MSQAIYTLKRFFPQSCRALTSLRLTMMPRVVQSVWLLLRSPRRYPHFVNDSALVEPFVLLVLSMICSLARISFDPNVVNSAQMLGLPSQAHALTVILVALGSMLGAMLIPMFWYAVLGIRIERDVFVAAMICGYAIIEIPWDISSITWIGFVRSGFIPVWMPDTLKTVLITVYCTLIAGSLPKSATEVVAQDANDTLR